MKRAIIVHQWMAGPDGDWRPWLKTELEKKGFEVLVPEMPDIDTPVIEAWIAKLSEVVGTPDKDTYFVGHSIGCQTILRYLENIQTPVGGAVFVAGWFNLENLEDIETEEIAKPWIETSIDLEKVKKVLHKSTLLISDNDPFGCFEENKKKFTELGSKIITMKGGGHVSAEEGFTELPVGVTELNRMSQEIIKEIGFDFDWDSRNVWLIDAPVEAMPIEQLTWIFDYPFWDAENTDDYNLTPWEVINGPEGSPTHYERVMGADLTHPIDLMENKGRLLILDGLHRLVKAYIDGQKTVAVRIIPRDKIPDILV
jgi:predicted alpha/beta hydrolase family esterase